MGTAAAILAILALLSRQPTPAPEDFGQPVTLRVELASLRVDPTPPERGSRVTGYLLLRPVVASSPERPAEDLETFGAWAWLPGKGLSPEPFQVIADGQWHRAELKAAPVVYWSDESPFEGFLTVYPLVRKVGSAGAGQAGVDVALYLEDFGWVREAQRRWILPGPSGDTAQITFSTPGGEVRVYLRFRQGRGNQ